MEITKEEIGVCGIKFSMVHEGKEVGRAYLYILKNDLHKQPFGFAEDLFLDEPLRGKGYGPQLMQAVLNEAKKRNCYKMIGTCRHTKPGLHKLYQKYGLRNQGLEFRIDF